MSTQTMPKIQLLLQRVPRQVDILQYPNMSGLAALAGASHEKLRLAAYAKYIDPSSSLDLATKRISREMATPFGIWKEKKLNTLAQRAICLLPP